MYVCLCVYATYEQSQRCQKKVLDPLELELQADGVTGPA